MSKKGGHHGGAWKVAYADFVTAMMALFMVLWLAAQDQKIKEAVERAFRNPFLSVTKASSGLMPTKNQDNGKTDGGSMTSSSGSPVESSMLRRLHTDLTRSLESSEIDEPGQEVIQFKLSQEGLRITIFDRTRQPIFAPDSAELTEYGRWILTTLAWELSRYKAFAIEVEGHTEAGRAALRQDYGNWELSADRANAGRRTLLEHGVNSDQVKKVAGFADTVPLEGMMPADPSNRRITLFLRVKKEKPSQRL